MKEERLDFLMISPCSVNVLDCLDLDKIADGWSKLIGDTILYLTIERLRF